MRPFRTITWQNKQIYPHPLPHLHSLTEMSTIIIIIIRERIPMNRWRARCCNQEWVEIMQRSQGVFPKIKWHLQTQLKHNSGTTRIKINTIWLTGAGTRACVIMGGGKRLPRKIQFRMQEEVSPHMGALIRDQLYIRSKAPSMEKLCWPVRWRKANIHPKICICQLSISLMAMFNSDAL